MAKIDSATLNVINEYYKTKESKLIGFQNEIKDKYNQKIENGFDDNEYVKEIRGLFHKLRKEYGDSNLELRCELYRYRNDTSYRNQEKWIEYEDKIIKLKKERSLLITMLECNPKNSPEYKEAYKKLQKLFK